jgi:hypothetical protein
MLTQINMLQILLIKYFTICTCEFLARAQLHSKIVIRLPVCLRDKYTTQIPNYRNSTTTTTTTTTQQ